MSNGHHPQDPGYPQGYGREAYGDHEVHRGRGPDPMFGGGYGAGGQQSYADQHGDGYYGDQGQDDALINAPYEFTPTDETRVDDFELMPKGRYSVTIEHAQWKPTRDRRGRYLELSLLFHDEGFKGRKLTDRLNLENPSPKAVQIAQKALTAILDQSGLPGFSHPDQLITGRVIPCNVSIEVSEDPQYRDKNRVSSWPQLATPKSAPPRPGGPRPAAQHGAPAGPPPGSRPLPQGGYTPQGAPPQAQRPAYAPPRVNPQPRPQQAQPYQVQPQHPIHQRVADDTQHAQQAQPQQNYGPPRVSQQQPQQPNGPAAQQPISPDDLPV